MGLQVNGNMLVSMLAPVIDSADDAELINYLFFARDMIDGILFAQPCQCQRACQQVVAEVIAGVVAVPNSHG